LPPSPLSLRSCLGGQHPSRAVAMKVPQGGSGGCMEGPQTWSTSTSVPAAPARCRSAPGQTAPQPHTPKGHVLVEHWKSSTCSCAGRGCGRAQERTCASRASQPGL